MEMEKPNGRGLTRLINAGRCSIAGIGYAIRHEAAFRQELIVCSVLIPLALFITADPVKRILLIGPLLLVLAVECANSAIEAAIDRISLSRHPLSKQAKDLGSAAVFFCMLIAALSWGLILFS
ncbi:diacylglycerol kinase [Aestuariibacter sp. AA17]|uniref:Diacylglycerol kinase n=1 Tax=Fluctibacter corallii TaxID=2984329 RepID=A0ABT3AAE4_9ALTE|nr:diacylglycerol kinase [Aestuariibacter sp. AA17]MCV2885645.1 diacylglycerol kinase [Aestuariibacter sp. AA17]